TVEGHEAPRNASLIPSVRTLADSKLGVDLCRGSALLEHYRGSLLQGYSAQGRRKIDLIDDQKVVAPSVYIGSQNPNS
ncbi:hypothetical protein BHE74_00053149, partial [Ensete ventricosum]